MFGHEVSVILFKFINFFAILALFTFIYRKYIQASLVEGIRSEKDAEDALQSRILTLSQKGQDLTGEMSEQEKQSRCLLEKADRWRSVTEIRHEHERLFMQENKEALRITIKQRTERLAQEKITAEVVPLAVGQLNREVRRIFSNDERIQEYTHNLIQSMRKSQP